MRKEAAHVPGELVEAVREERVGEAEDAGMFVGWLDEEEIEEGEEAEDEQQADVELGQCDEGGKKERASAGPVAT